jgi:hypothetical protein
MTDVLAETTPLIPDERAAELAQMTDPADVIHEMG